MTAKIYTLLSDSDKFTTVEENVVIEGPDGPRQFDVVVRSVREGLDVLTVIECKDYKSKIDLKIVDAFESKVRDIGAHNAILVTRTGYQSGAFRKAKRVGITLCTAHDIDGLLENIAIRIPVVMRDILDYKFNPNFKSYTPHGVTVLRGKPMLYIGGKAMDVAFDDALHSGMIPLDPLNEDQLWVPVVSDANYVRTEYNHYRSIESLSVQYILTGVYYFGYLHELPDSIGLNNLSDDTSVLFFNDQSLINDYRSNFEKFNFESDLPRINSVSLSVLKAPVKRIGPETTITLRAKQLDSATRQ